MALVIALSFVVVLASCGGQQANQDDEEARTVERTVVETVEVTQEETIEETVEETTQETTAISTSVDCSGFGDQMAAQQFYDFTATEAEQQALDTDGNGLACDEPENEATAEPQSPQEAELYAQLDEIPLDSEPRERLEFGRDVSDEVMEFESCVFSQSTEEQVQETRDLGVASFERVRALYEQGACVEEFNLMMDAAERDIYISAIEAQQYLDSL